jgi:hypothetical protein
VVPEDHLKVAHGYATTSHSSQGLTANFAVVFGASFDQKRLSSMVARNKGDSGSFSKPVALSTDQGALRACGEPGVPSLCCLSL